MSPSPVCPHGYPRTPGDPDACPVCTGAAMPETVSSGPGPDSAPTVLAAGKIPPPDASVPDAPHIPGYEILGRLGEGGMGAVYKARQLSLNRVLALKVLQAGVAATPRQRLRFRMEAESVAALQHPNIVQIHEVGEHDGRPYFSMEYVDGGSLDRRLARRPLPFADAAALVETLARAVHAAHLRGIVHRDLKPGNILLQRKDGVDPGGEFRVADFVPKVSDFGLAKQLRPDAARGGHEEPARTIDTETPDAPPPGPGPEPGAITRSGLTATGVILGTPSYMAPEQALGRVGDISPLTDVYALGAILYELLTGLPPFAAGSALRTAEQVVREEPVPPSRLRPKLPRDLETICLTCLRKEPTKRYPSAEALAEDLRRFRSHEPIRARPAGRLERLGKWVRRNPSRAALVALLAAAALAALAGGLLHNQRLRAERDRAERNADLALRAVNEMLTEVAVEQLAYEPRTEEKRRRLLEKARAFYEDLLRERADDPGVRRHAALGYRHMADVLRQMGEYPDAERHYGEAITRLGALLAESPADPELRGHLADAHNFRGEVFRLTSRPGPAADDYRRAAELLERLAAADPGRPLARLGLARARYNLGLALRAVGELPAALAETTAAVDHLRALAGSHPEPVYRQHLARALINQGVVLRQRGRTAAAGEAYEEAIALLDRLRREDPEMPDYRHELGVASNNLGNLLQSGPDRRPADAERAHRRAVELFRGLRDDFPRVVVYRRELANSLNSLAAALYPRHRPGEAVAAWEEAAAVLRGLAAEAPGVAEYRGDLGRVLGNIGGAHFAAGNHAEARPRFEEGIGLLAGALRPNPGHADYLASFRSQQLALAGALARLGEHEAARRRLGELPATFPHIPRAGELALCGLARCVAAVEASDPPQRREELAAPYVRLAEELLRAAARADPAAPARLAADPAFAPLAARPEILPLLPKRP